MPGPKQVRFVRGNLRQLVSDIRRDLVALIATNDRRPSGSLLTSEQRATASAVASDMLLILQAKKFR